MSFEALFWPWLYGASQITITDPYIRLFHQARNLMELLELVAARKPRGELVRVSLRTVADDFDPDRQAGYLNSIQDGMEAAGITFDWEALPDRALHARHIVTDTGWKISLDRGLDIFQKFDLNDAFSLANKRQEFRRVKGFEITWMRIRGEQSE